MGIKYPVNENFFDTWSPRMSYILGYLYADGSLEDAHYLRGKYIRVTSVDRELIELVKSSLDSGHTIVMSDSPFPHGKIRYSLRIGSHKMYASLSNHGLYPNKSLTITLPKIPRACTSDFIRGYFDGDGCVHIERGVGKSKQKILKRLLVVFTSGSKSFLEQLASLLKSELGLNQSKVYTTQKAFQLRYSTEDSVKIFNFLYKKQTSISRLFLNRKKDVFTRYFNARPSRVNTKTQKILQCMERKS